MTKTKWNKNNAARRVGARIDQETSAKTAKAFEDDPANGFLGCSDLLGDRPVTSRDDRFLGYYSEDGNIRRKPRIAKRR
jgi:hypothetical protein